MHIPKSKPQIILLALIASYLLMTSSSLAQTHGEQRYQNNSLTRNTNPINTQARQNTIRQAWHERENRAEFYWFENQERNFGEAIYETICAAAVGCLIFGAGLRELWYGDRHSAFWLLGLGSGTLGYAASKAARVFLVSRTREENSE